MTINSLGYNEELDSYRKEQKLDDYEIGRVILEHKERYVIRTSEQEFDAELIGNLRYTAESRYDFPAVGDWVAFTEYDEGKALIHAIYPRQSIIERRAVGKTGQVQIIATNVDYGLIVQAVDRDFNLNRLERYLTICHTAKISPIIILSKIDLIEEEKLKSLEDQISNRIKDIPIITVSNQTKGYDDLKAVIKEGKTYCLLGSSGVGKSTALNNLMSTEKMKTGAISTSVNKGKHVTSHRELVVIENGGILIDNPGMREVGITDSTGGLEDTFEVIYETAQNCRFKDCTHTNEKDCAVLLAVDDGEIDIESYNNFRKMEKERSHFELDAQARRQKDKDFGKMIKHIQKQRRKTKY